MNWRILLSLISLFATDLYAQDVQTSQYCVSDIIYTNLYEAPCNVLLLSGVDSRELSDYGTTTTIYSSPCTSKVQYGLSIAQDQKKVHHSHHAIPSYDQHALSAQICQSWSQQRFTQEIERSIEYCISCGCSRDQAEQEILQQHHLYLFPNFIKSIKTLSGYRSHIKNLCWLYPPNKPGFWSKALALLTCANRRHAEFVAIAHKLNAEVLQQEKNEKAQRKSAENKRNSPIDTLQLTRYRQAEQKARQIKQETVRKTFDAQCDDLANESTEWQELLDIYQEESLGNTTRIERRIQMLQTMSNGQVIYTEQSYTLSSSASNLIHQAGGDSENYKSNYGNQLQQVIHQECIDGIEHLTNICSSAVLHPYKQGIAGCFDAAREYNQAGWTSKAATISDFCWMLLDCGLAIAEGAVDGVIGAVKDMAEHPVQTAICAIAGEYVLAYQLSKILYNAVDIGITALVDADRAAQKWDDYIAPITQLINAIENQQITLRDAINGATQFAVHWKTQGKLLKGLGNICTTAKTKAIEFAKNNQLSTPQDYMATSEGTLLKYVDKSIQKDFTKSGNTSKFFSENRRKGGVGVQITNKQALEVAQQLGFKKTNFYSHGKSIFQKGNQFITIDGDSHNGGFWKMANSVENLSSKKTRLGTYDKNLNRIGD